MVILVLVITAILSKTLLGNAKPSDKTPLTRMYLFANLASGFLAAAASGYIAALIGRGQPAVRILSVIVLVVGIGFGLASKGGPQPQWYLLVLPVISALGTLVWGLVARRILSAVSERKALSMSLDHFSKRAFSFPQS